MSNFFFRLIRGRSNSIQAVAPRSDEPNRLTSKLFRISVFRAAQMFQTATSIARATRARGRLPPGLAMACSLKDFLQGSRGIRSTSPDPTNQLPTSHSGQAQRPPGGSIASLQPSKNSTRYPLCATSGRSCSPLRLQLFENSNHPALTQAKGLWESVGGCGKPFLPLL